MNLDPDVNVQTTMVQYTPRFCLPLDLWSKGGGPIVRQQSDQFLWHTSEACHAVPVDTGKLESGEAASCEVLTLSLLKLK